jgi:hypothetical protein
MLKKNAAFLVALAFCVPALSQTTGNKNMGKINLSAFAFKGLGLQYERQVAPRITVALGYSMIPKSGISFKGALENAIDDPDVNVGAFQLGTSIFTPEVRYYLGKKGAFHGFYFAPYARIGNYKIQGPVSYTTSTNVKREAVFDGKLNTFTGGLMLGSSWQLGSKFYLDWWIIGASFGGANGDLIAATKLNAVEQASLKNELDEIEVVGTEITSEVNSEGATVRTTGSMVGARGLGINFGIRF